MTTTASDLALFEIRVDEFVAAALRRLHDRDIALDGPLLHPVLKLIGNLAQGGPRHWIELAIRIEEADDPLGLLEWLNQPVQQNAVETPVMPADAVLVMLVKGRLPSPSETTGAR
jgi:hypothetical protein